MLARRDSECNRMRLAEMRADPVEQPRQPPGFVGRDRTRHELRLVAVAMRRNDQALRDLVRDLRSVIPAHEMQQHVEACCRARRRQHLTLVDVQRVRLDPNPRIALRQQLRVAPVRRHRLPSSTPAAASTNTPEQIEQRRAPRS